MPKRYLGKLFRNGGSQAVRLPKACRLSGVEVAIIREGGRLILEPIDRRGWSRDFLELISTPASRPLFPPRDQPPAQERDFDP